MKAFAALVSALWRYAQNRRWIVIVYLCMFVIGNIIWLFEPFVVGKLINGLQESTASGSLSPQFFGLVILLVVLSAGFWLFHGPARILERTTAFHIRASFKDRLFGIVTSLPLQWHRSHHSGQTINRIGKATRALFEFSENGYQLIEMIIRPLGSAVALMLIMPTAAGLAIAISMGSLIIVFLFDRVLLPLYDKLNEDDHFVASALHDYLTNITTVITLRLEALTQSELWRRMTHYFPTFRREVNLNEAKWFTATMIISTMTAAVLAWYAWSSLKMGMIPLAGTFYMLYDYLQKIGGSFYTFAWKYSQVVSQYADLRSVDGILNAERAEYHYDCKLPADWKEISIQGLDFTYRDEQQKEQHLSGVDLSLRRGRKIALVGESGSGKSTIMGLIRGLHTAEKADVFCDGTKLKHGLKDVASSVTLIPQDPEIFQNTIEYNISLDTTHNKTELMDDVELAAFGKVLSRLPKGLKTNIAEKGVNLSGGEKQRLALARGFFAAKQSDIILLDEPTSSVDSQNEMRIYKNLMERFSDRCIVSSIHKLNLLNFFDDVYVFDHGRMVQHGPVQELLQKDGLLKKLWTDYQKSQKD